MEEKKQKQLSNIKTTLTETGRTVTEVNKLPDRSALLKLMEIEGVYVDANVKLKQQKVDEVSTEKELVDLVEGLAIE